MAILGKEEGASPVSHFWLAPVSLEKFFTAYASFCLKENVRYPAGPQPEEDNRQLPLPKFSQTYVFVRYSNKLHHFDSPKISVDCGPSTHYAPVETRFLWF